MKWDLCCRPLEEEGLDLIDIQLSGKVSALKNVWELLSGVSNVWIDWAKATLLKNKSFWQVAHKDGDSWYWRYLLECRGEFQNYLRKVIGSGEANSLWFDCWLNSGPLFRAFGDCPWYAADLTEGASVSCLIKEERWEGNGSERQQEIVSLAQNISINLTTEDFLVYGDRRRRDWNAKEVKNLLRGTRRNQGCKELLWFRNFIPHFSFVVWTAYLNKLPTAERLGKWGINVNEVCVLCKAHKESRDHLFFECEFAVKI